MCSTGYIGTSHSKILLVKNGLSLSWPCIVYFFSCATFAVVLSLCVLWSEDERTFFYLPRYSLLLLNHSLTSIIGLSTLIT
jgi:hypothetical protein